LGTNIWMSTTRPERSNADTKSSSHPRLRPIERVPTRSGPCCCRGLTNPSLSLFTLRGDTTIAQLDWISCGPQRPPQTNIARLRSMSNRFRGAPVLCVWMDPAFITSCDPRIVDHRRDSQEALAWSGSGTRHCTTKPRKLSTKLKPMAVGRCYVATYKVSVHSTSKSPARSRVRPEASDTLGFVSCLTFAHNVGTVCKRIVK
jgi:hypothetical protein